MKKRIDVLLYEKGLAPSREKARTLIMAGCVYADNQKFDKPGDTCLLYTSKQDDAERRRKREQQGDIARAERV